MSRLSLTENYYLLASQNSQSGFVEPGFTQSVRWLFKPTTTLVTDYNASSYNYNTPGFNSLGQSLAAGFDHTFSPKLFWNFRGGAQIRSYQNANTGQGLYFGPYVDSNLSLKYGQSSSLAWVAHVGTQPSGQKGISYSPSLSSGLNVNQGLTTKLSLTGGLFFLWLSYPDAPGLTPPTASNPQGLLTYTQTNLQGNIGLNFQLNRILQISTGIQYITQSSPSVTSQEYNRGIGFLQLQGGF